MYTTMNLPNHRTGTTLRSRLLAGITALLVLALCLFTALPAHAANAAPTTNLEFTFNKYLVLDKDTKVPPVTFTFSIAPGQKGDATGQMPAIYAGDDAQRVTGMPTVGTAVFTDTDIVYTASEPGDNVTLGTDDGYAKKSVTVDFEGVSFKAPGIYRYTITETAPTQDGVAIEGNNTRTLDVFVEYVNPDQSGQLQISKYALQDGTSADPHTAKSAGFTNTYTSHALTLAKTVTGNQGDRDKYFTFTVDIASPNGGTVYAVDVTDAAGDTEHTNPQTITAGTQATYYLKHGQSIIIRGLTEKTKYTIAEADYSTDGYTTTNTDNAADGKTTSEKTMGNTDHTVTFTNDKAGAVPTGVLLDVAPYLLLVAAAAVGLGLLVAGGKRRNR